MDPKFDDKQSQERRSVWRGQNFPPTWRAGSHLHEVTLLQLGSKKEYDKALKKEGEES